MDLATIRYFSQVYIAQPEVLEAKVRAMPNHDFPRIAIKHSLIRIVRHLVHRQVLVSSRNRMRKLSHREFLEQAEDNLIRVSVRLCREMGYLLDNLKRDAPMPSRCIIREVYDLSFDELLERNG